MKHHFHDESNHEQYRKRVKKSLIVETPLNNGLLQEDDYALLERLRLKEKALNKQSSSVQSLLLKLGEDVNEAITLNENLHSFRNRIGEVYQSPVRNFERSNLVLKNSIDSIRNSSILKEDLFLRTPLRHLSPSLSQPIRSLDGNTDDFSTPSAKLTIHDLVNQSNSESIQHSYEELMRLRQKREYSTRERIRKQQQLIESFEKQQYEKELKKREEKFLLIAKNHYRRVSNQQFFITMLRYRARTRRFGVRLHEKSKRFFIGKAFSLLKLRIFKAKFIRSQGELGYYKLLSSRFIRQIQEYCLPNALWQMKLLHRAKQFYVNYRQKKFFKELKFLLHLRKQSQQLMQMEDYCHRKLLRRYFPLLVDQISYLTYWHRRIHHKTISSNATSAFRKLEKIFVAILISLRHQAICVARAKHFRLQRILRKEFPIFQILQNRVYFDFTLQKKAKLHYEGRKKRYFWQQFISVISRRLSLRRKLPPSVGSTAVKSRSLKLNLAFQGKDVEGRKPFNLYHYFGRWLANSVQNSASKGRSRINMIQRYLKYLKLVQQQRRITKAPTPMTSFSTHRFLQVLQNQPHRFLSKLLFKLQNWKSLINHFSSFRAKRSLKLIRIHRINILHLWKMKKFFRRVCLRIMAKKRFVFRLQLRRQKKIRLYWVIWKKQLSFQRARRQINLHSHSKWKKGKILLSWQRWKLFLHARLHFTSRGVLTEQHDSQKYFFFSPNSIKLLKYQSFFQRMKQLIFNKKRKIQLIRRMRSQVYAKLLRESLKVWYHYIFHALKIQLNCYDSKGRKFFRRKKLLKLFSIWKELPRKRVAVLQRIKDYFRYENKNRELSLFTVAMKDSISDGRKKKKGLKPIASSLEQCIVIRRYLLRWADYSSQRQINSSIKQHDGTKQPKRIQIQIKGVAHYARFRNDRLKHIFFQKLYQRKERSIYFRDVVSRYYQKHRRIYLLQKSFRIFSDWIQNQLHSDYQRRQISLVQYHRYRYRYGIISLKQWLKQRQLQSLLVQQCTESLHLRFHLPKALSHWKDRLLQTTKTKSLQQHRTDRHRRLTTFYQILHQFRRYYSDPRFRKRQADQYYVRHRMSLLLQFWITSYRAKKYRKRIEHKIISKYQEKYNRKRVNVAFQVLKIRLRKLIVCRKRGMIVQRRLQYGLLAKYFLVLLNFSEPPSLTSVPPSSLDDPPGTANLPFQKNDPKPTTRSRKEFTNIESSSDQRDGDIMFDKDRVVDDHYAHSRKDERSLSLKSDKVLRNPIWFGKMEKEEELKRIGDEMIIVAERESSPSSSVRFLLRKSASNNSLSSDVSHASTAVINQSNEKEKASIESKVLPTNQLFSITTARNPSLNLSLQSGGGIHKNSLTKLNPLAALPKIERHLWLGNTSHNSKGTAFDELSNPLFLLSNTMNATAQEVTRNLTHESDNRIKKPQTSGRSVFRSGSTDSVDSLGGSSLFSSNASIGERSQLYSLTKSIKYYNTRKYRKYLFQWYSATQKKKVAKVKVKYYQYFRFLKRWYAHLHSGSRPFRLRLIQAKQFYQSYQVHRNYRTWRDWLLKRKVYSISSHQRIVDINKSRGKFHLNAVKAAEFSNEVKDRLMVANQRLHNLRLQFRSSPSKEYGANEITLKHIMLYQMNKRRLAHYLLFRWRKYYHCLRLVRREKVNTVSDPHLIRSRLKRGWIRWNDYRRISIDESKPRFTAATHHFNNYKTRRCLQVLELFTRRIASIKQEKKLFEEKMVQSTLWKWKKYFFGIASLQLEMMRLSPSPEFSPINVIISSTARNYLRTKSNSLLSALYSQQRLFSSDCYVFQRKLYLISVSQSKASAIDSCVTFSRKLRHQSCGHHVSWMLKHYFQQFQRRLSTFNLYRTNQYAMHHRYENSLAKNILMKWSNLTKMRHIQKAKMITGIQRSQIRSSTKIFGYWKHLVFVRRQFSEIQRQRYFVQYFRKWNQQYQYRRRMIRFLSIFIRTIRKEYTAFYYSKWKFSVSIEIKLKKCLDRKGRRLLLEGWEKYYHLYHVMRMTQRRSLAFALQHYRQKQYHVLIKRLLDDLERRYFHQDLWKRSQIHHQNQIMMNGMKHLLYLKRNRIAATYHRYKSFQSLLYCLRQNYSFYQRYQQQYLGKKVQRYKLIRGWRKWTRFFDLQLRWKTILHKRNRQRFFLILQTKYWIVQERKSHTTELREDDQNENEDREIFEIEDGKKRETKKERFLRKLTFNRSHQSHQLQFGKNPVELSFGSDSFGLRNEELRKPDNHQVLNPLGFSSKAKFYEGQEKKFHHLYDLYAVKQKLHYSFTKLFLMKQQKRKLRQFYMHYTNYYILGSQLLKNFHKLLKHRNLCLRRRKNSLLLQQLQIQLVLKRCMQKLDYRRIQRWKQFEENRCCHAIMISTMLKKGFQAFLRYCQQQPHIQQSETLPKASFPFCVEDNFFTQRQIHQEGIQCKE